RVAKKLLSENYVRLDVQPRTNLRPSTHTLDRTVMPTGQRAGRFQPPAPSRKKLKNGLTVMHLERQGLPLVSFGLMVKSGAIADPEATPGLTHLTTTLLQEGTSGRSSQDISGALESLGTHLDTDVSREHILLSMDLLAANWTKALGLLGEIVTDPAFPQKELERVRKQRLTDLKRVTDDPTAIAMRASRALLYGADHPYGHPVSGTERSVAAVSREDVVAHYKRLFTPDDATFIVVGPVSMDEAVKQAEAAFGSWKRSRKGAENNHVAVGEQPGATTIYLADKRGAAQSVIYAGQVTIPRHHADFYAMNLLNLVLGGQFSARLNMNLRQDKGYSYGYMSGIDWLRGPSAFLAGGAVQTRVTKEAVIETLAELRDIHGKRPVTSQEFENARQGVFRGFASAFETQSQILHQMARMALFDLPDTYFQEYVSNLEKVKLQDVRRVAKEELSKGPTVLLVVGDMGEVESGLRELEINTEIVDYEGRVTS
ncbi:MAG: insulinase family protein, partial [SAR202 cluster bacterium]|nr:insulinase family protein [SAR202 cluster bacterium]